MSFDSAILGDPEVGGGGGGAGLYVSESMLLSVLSWGFFGESIAGGANE